MNIRPAPLQFILAIKRRLETTTPGAVLDEKSVKLVAIPQTHFDATVFMFSKGGKTKLVAELARPDLPHIYAGKTVDPNEAGSAAALVWVITQIGYRILRDPVFSRGNIIQINGFSRAA
jgi:hypothetical protein